MNLLCEVKRDNHRRDPKPVPPTVVGWLQVDYYHKRYRYTKRPIPADRLKYVNTVVLPRDSMMPATWSFETQYPEDSPYWDWETWHPQIPA